MLIPGDQIGDEQSRLLTKKGREQWEDRFSKTHLVPILQVKRVCSFKKYVTRTFTHTAVDALGLNLISDLLTAEKHNLIQAKFIIA